MANREEVDLVTNFISEGYRNVKRDIDDLAKSQEKQDQANQKSRMGMADLKAGLDIVGQAYRGVSQVVQFTANAINEGANLQLARSQFENLTASIGTTSESMMTDLRAATNGMVSDADLIAGASEIISLGLADNQEDTVRLANAVGTLGLDMQQVILTFANNSKARLDSLGLSIQDVDRITDEFIATGMDANQAFDQAVLVALEDKMALLGSTADTTAGSIAKLTAHQENLTNKFNEFMAVQWEPILGGLVNTIDAVGESAAKGHDPLLQTVVIMEELGATISGRTNPIVQNWIKTRKEEAEAAEEAGKATDAQIAGYERMIQSYAIINSATEEQAEFVRGLTRDNDDLNDKLAQSEHHLTEQEASIQAANRAMERAAEANADHAKAAEEAAKAIEAEAKAEQQLTAETAKFFNTLDDVDKLEEYESILGDTSETTVRISGRTAEQQDALSELQKQYDKAQDTINDYTFGVKGLGMSEEERNAKIQEQIELQGQLQGAMDPLLAIQSEYATIVGDGSINQQLLNEKIFESIQANTDSATAIAMAGEALGIYTEEEANARLEAALLDEFIRRQISAWDGTREGTLAAKAAIEGYIEQLNNIPSEVTTTVTQNHRTTGGGAAAAQAMAEGGSVRGGGGNANVGFANGVSNFTVPAGFPNDSFMVGLTSGETVSVNPNGGAVGGTQINGPLIGQVVMNQGENVNVFAARVSGMVSTKLGELS